MKAFLGEYGKIIITILVGLTLFIFIFSNKSDGFRASLPKPTVTYGTTTSKNTVNEITGRSKPFLTFLSDAKLSVNQTYDLENKDQMKIQAENANGTPLPIEVTSIIDNNNNTVSLSKKKQFQTKSRLLYCLLPCERNLQRCNFGNRKISYFFSKLRRTHYERCN